MSGPVLAAVAAGPQLEVAKAVNPQPSSEVRIHYPTNSKLRVALSIAPVVGMVMAIYNEYSVLAEWKKSFHAQGKEMVAKKSDAEEKEKVSDAEVKEKESDSGYSRKVELINKKNNYKDYAIASCIITALAVVVLGLVGTLSFFPTLLLAGASVGMGVWEYRAMQRNKQSLTVLQHNPAENVKLY